MSAEHVTKADVAALASDLRHGLREMRSAIEGIDNHASDEVTSLASTVTDIEGTLGAMSEKLDALVEGLKSPLSEQIEELLILMREQNELIRKVLAAEKPTKAAKRKAR